MSSRQNTTSAAGNLGRDTEFHALVAGMNRTFTGRSGPLFRVSSDGLFDAFLAALDEAVRPEHVCSSCRAFVRRFGGLVSIDAEGTTESALWPADGVPSLYRAGVQAIRREVLSRPVTSVFLSADKVLGVPESNAWNHMSLSNDAPFSHPFQTAAQVAAERSEDFRMIARSLAEFPLTVAEQALAIAASESLYRSEKVLGVAQWLVDLHRTLKGVQHKWARDNIIWRAAATAPTGFAHVRSSMIGTLLEDIAAGLPLGDIKAKFAAKMHPLQYMRPSAAPSEGNIAQAEAIVEKLGAAGSLARRFARLSDVQTMWLPRPEAPAKAGGVFGHLRNAAEALTVTGGDAVTMTFEKFARTILHSAERIEYQTQGKPTAFIALVTAVNPDAPVLFQWGHHVNWYVYNGGSHARDWNLPADTWVEVTAAIRNPAQWGGDRAHHGDGVILALRGAKDLKSDTAGAALFPETLKSDYHPVRRTIEAHSRRSTIAGRDEAEACGIDIRKGSPANHLLRVTSQGTRILYRIDRWD